MCIAQHPCGTWCAYEEKPVEKMGGWDGKVVGYPKLDGYVKDWRETLKEVSFNNFEEDL